MRGRQEPRLSHIPDGVEHPDLDAALELNRAAGIILDPWQELVFRGACLRRDGIWAARQVGLCCPRQNGKNEILVARQLAGMFIFGERLQRYTAHLTDTAAVAFKRLAEIVESTPWLASELKSVWRANGKEAVELKNGNTVQFRTRTDRAGRGPSPNTIYYDEAMELSEAAVTASIPSVAARSMSAAPPQLWYTGSAVDQLVHDGLVFTRVRDQGLKGNHETAWFEWSVESDGPENVANYDSPEQWAIANPGMNIRISEEFIAFEMNSPMGLRGFLIERLGAGDWFSLAAESGIFDMEKWASLTDGKSQISKNAIFCFDVSPNRAWGSICVGGLRNDGFSHVEITGRGTEIDRRRGTGWMVERLAELAERQKPAMILCDERGPAQTLVPELERLGVKVETVNASEYAQACGLFFDDVEQGKIRHIGQPEMTAALRAATKRPLGDRFAWDRKNSSDDITSLVAASIANWKAKTDFRPEPIAVWA